MLFHPGVLALMLVDAIALLLLLPAAWFAVRLLRHWDLASGSARQIRLERSTYLMTTVLGFVFLAQLLSLLLLVFTADSLASQFVGAMCAVGSFNANAWGFPALLLKLALFLLAAAWLLMNHLDNRAPDYPLIRVKYAFLLLILPVAVAAAVVQQAYFLNLDADVITSCCGSLFSGRDAVAGELAGLPPGPAMLAFYAVFGTLVLAGSFVLWRRRGALLFSALSMLALPVALVAMVAFIGLYIYEHPNHHCPFCVLKAEYDYLGYALYLPLFTASALGFGLSATLPFARAASLRPVLDAAVPRLVGLATGLFALFIVLVSWLILRSNLILIP